MPKKRNRKPFQIRLSDRQPHEIAPHWWRDYLARGIVRPEPIWDDRINDYRPSRRIAEPAKGFCVWLNPDGELCVLDYRVLNQLRLYIGLNCRMIEQHGALYCELSPEQLQRAVQRDYCLRV